MRQYLHKTGLLLTIFIMVSVVFNLCGAAIKHQKEPEKLLPNLSNEYVLAERNNSMKIKTYITYFEKVKKEFLLGVVLDSNMRAVYAKDNMWKGLRLLSGHTFTEKDYDTRTNTVLISDGMQTLCQKVDGVYYYDYNGEKYEVIGVYKDTNSSGIYSPKCILNLYASSLQSEKNWEIGFFDCGNNTWAQLNNCGISKNKSLKIYAATNKKDGYFANKVTNINMMLIIYAGLGFMILLHSLTATENWIEGKKHEIVIRRLVGATKTQIFKWLLLQFVSLLLITVFVGAFLTKVLLICNYNWYLSYTISAMFGTRLSYLSIFYNIIFFIVIGIILILMVMFTQRKKTIRDMLHEG